MYDVCYLRDERRPNLAARWPRRDKLYQIDFGDQELQQLPRDKRKVTNLASGKAPSELHDRGGQEGCRELHDSDQEGCRTFLKDFGNEQTN